MRAGAGAVLLILAAIILLGGGLYFSILKTRGAYAGPVEKINLGAANATLSALAWVAQARGYFLEEGIDVEIRDFDSGRTAMSTMFEGGVDMVTVGQIPVVIHSFSRSDYAVIATITRSDNNLKAIGRADRGITKPSDLMGRKIGVTKGSTGHFFLSSFMTYHGLAIPDDAVIDMKGPELVQALTEGRLDAAFTWEPYVSNARSILGDRGILFESKGILREHFFIAAQKRFIANHSKALERFLKAIDRAEKFIREHRDDAIAIVAARMGEDRGATKEAWGDFEFRLMLDQSILINLEDSARWAIANKLEEGGAAQVPNYLDFIYPDALKAVKPEAVTVAGR